MTYTPGPPPDLHHDESLIPGRHTPPQHPEPPPQIKQRKRRHPAARKTRFRHRPERIEIRGLIRREIPGRGGGSGLGDRRTATRCFHAVVQRSSVLVTHMGIGHSWGLVIWVPWGHIADSAHQRRTAATPSHPNSSLLFPTVYPIEAPSGVCLDLCRAPQADSMQV